MEPTQYLLDKGWEFVDIYINCSEQIEKYYDINLSEFQLGDYAISTHSIELISEEEEEVVFGCSLIIMAGLGDSDSPLRRQDYKAKLILIRND